MPLCLIISVLSYLGHPADNAKHFVEWLSNLKSDSLGGVAFATFGCGNKDWQATYQRIPKLCDTTLSDCGAKRLLPRGEADAGSGEFFESFDAWETALWGSLSQVNNFIISLTISFNKNIQEYKTEAATTETGGGLKVETVSTGTARAEILRQPDAALGTVIENRILTTAGVAEKRHIGMSL